MKRIIIFFLAVQLSFLTFAQSQIIADHTVVDQYNQIPQQYIDEVKKMWLVVAGESHSIGYMLGLDALETSDPTFQVHTLPYSGDPDPYTDQYLRASKATWGDIDNESGWVYSYG